MTAVLGALASVGVVPVVVIDDPASALALGEALARGGLPTAEITLRTPGALDAVRELAGLEGFLVGAGTVVDPQGVAAAVAAGAQYLVSPGFSAAVSREAATLGVPLVPGVMSPTELMSALDAGHSIVKFFPAGAAGGLNMLSALAAPFPGARFMPTGGISLEALPGFLAHPAVFAVGGTWVAPRQAIQSHDFEQIAVNAAQASAVVKGAR